MKPVVYVKILLILSIILFDFGLIGLTSIPPNVLKTSTTAEHAGELTAIDVPINALPILKKLNIYFQEEPRHGAWRAAATTLQLATLTQAGIRFDVIGKVALFQGGKNHESQASLTSDLFCFGENGGNYPIPDDPAWVYDPIFLNCTSATIIDSIDIYYDVIHPRANYELDLHLGSNSPSWFYITLETSDSCEFSSPGEWHKYALNITDFNGRPVNQRWDLALRDFCPNSYTGYVDYWVIWVYYSRKPNNIDAEIMVSTRASDEINPAIAYNSLHNEYLVVWENDWGGGYHDIYAQRVAANGALLSWFSISTSTNSKTEPAVAYDPRNDRYLVVFLYDAYGDGRDWDVMGRYIPWNGPDNALTDFNICTWTSQQIHPEVAYGYEAQSYLTVWKNGGTNYISGRLIYANGSGMGMDFTVSSGSEARDHPDVTYNLARNEFLVVWDVDKSSSGVSLDIQGQRYRGDAIPLGSVIDIAGWPSREEKPSVAACEKADQYLVGWQSDDGSGMTEFAIYARYLNGDAIPGSVKQIANTYSIENEVDASCNFYGNQYFLSWQSMYPNGQYGIWAREVNSDGNLLPPFLIFPPTNSENRTNPANGGGRRYMVAWEHQLYGGLHDIWARMTRHLNFLPLIQK